MQIVTELFKLDEGEVHIKGVTKVLVLNSIELVAVVISIMVEQVID